MEEDGMQKVVTARHVEIAEGLKKRATAVLERFTRYVRGPIESSVTFDRDGHEAFAEVRLHVAHGEWFVAKSVSKDHRSALDRAEAKMRRQIEKVFGRPPRTRARRVARQSLA
jgi:ribosomal subunit interface protein